MIYLDSRYAAGTLAKTWNAQKRQYDLIVFREWLEYFQTFFLYNWVENDRLDILADRFLGNPALWWEIMDLNPEILDPLSIQPGTQIRIPNA